MAAFTSAWLVPPCVSLDLQAAWLVMSDALVLCLTEGFHQKVALNNARIGLGVEVKLKTR